MVLDRPASSMLVKKSRYFWDLVLRSARR